MSTSFIQYFQNLEQRPLERLLLLVAGMLLLWILEGAIPLFSLTYKKTKWRHAGINLSLTLIHLLIHTGFAVFIILLSDAAKKYEFGLVYWFHASIFLTILISFIALDFFGGWLVHLIQHKTSSLWRFHIVHHSDNNVDVTTGLRHHPIESVLRGVFFLIGVAVAGAPVYAVMIVQTIFVLFTQFTHANISLPKQLDKTISYILVSPNMHKVHHHWQQPYTDSNYGLTLSIWDRLFGTYKNLDPFEIRYGLDRYYPNEEDENLGLLMKRPFGKIDKESARYEDGGTKKLEV
ncbi:sterol desaturase family protein [Chitinophagaceae bacterium LB-8]|uniref:Sterol desaturase family protein n=1 Tax=Paraflavisolibacter caeni TaxID=2982496 RepID=A0A9X2XXN3_9BACT|nr:sterol desaturase family protein [Paraflavisolibacter caeni]MCU7550995.1 sterol desaturase family protein [Paraflavisolibacter caeni]